MNDEINGHHEEAQIHSELYNLSNEKESIKSDSI